METEKGKLSRIGGLDMRKWYSLIDKVYALGNLHQGYGVYVYKGEGRFRMHPKSVQKLKDKIREITRRSNSWSIEYRKTRLNQFIRGWVNYFKLADNEEPDDTA